MNLRQVAAPAFELEQIDGQQIQSHGAEYVGDGQHQR